MARIGIVLASIVVLLQAGCQSPCYQGICQPNRLSWLKKPCSGLWGPWWHKKLRLPGFGREYGCRPSFAPTLCGRYSPKSDDHAVRRAAARCAAKALSRLRRETGEWYSSDFKNGFRQAYTDIARGGLGVTPAIPPEKYWSAYYRTSSGHQRAWRWFEGYELGAEEGLNDLTEFNDIASSTSVGSGHSVPFETPVNTIPYDPQGAYGDPQGAYGPMVPASYSVPAPPIPTPGTPNPGSGWGYRSNWPQR